VRRPLSFFICSLRDLHSGCKFSGFDIMSSDWRNDAFLAMKQIRCTQKLMESKYKKPLPPRPQATMVAHKIDSFSDREMPATMVAHSTPLIWKPFTVELIKSECVRTLMDEKYCKKRASPPQATMVAHKIESFTDRQMPATMVAHSSPLIFKPIAVELIQSECVRKLMDNKYCKKTGKYKIVMVIHGESTWNLENRFCGWFDADLSDKGVKEAHAGGKALNNAGYKFDVAHTSQLQRAQKTLGTILSEIGQPDLPTQKNWRLNDRHYGGLTGLNKAETAELHGEKQVQIWRRSFATPPPKMEKGHNYIDILTKDQRYREDPAPEEFPVHGSLKMTIARTLPYWNNVIVPQIKSGKNILIAAHGNSLRGVVKHLDNLSDEEIMTLNLPTGIPFVYELDEDFRPVVSMKFLGDEETVRKALEAVANQGKAKKVEKSEKFASQIGINGFGLF